VNTSPRPARTFLCGILCAFLLASPIALAQSKPLSEVDLTSLAGLGIDDSAIIARVQKGGVSFPVDDAVIQRLKDAGVSEKVIAAAQKAALAPPARKSDKPPIELKDVLKLLELGVEEATILKRINESPISFVLSAEQERQVVSKGASPQLVASLKGVRTNQSSDKEVSNLAIVLDCSKSMLEQTTEGEPKITVAKRVVGELISQIPDGLSVSLVVYGHDAKDLCQVKVARPLSLLDAAAKQQLVTLIGQLPTMGNTPIASSLDLAGSVLKKADGNGGILLISDGVETCKGDPKGVAAKLAADPRLTFGVNVVGFGLAAKEQQSLEQIAKAGKGTYYNADNAQEFGDALKRVRESIEQNATPSVDQRKARATEFAGEVGKPGTFLHDAGLVKPGEYKGKLAMMQTDYYRLPVVNGQELRVIGQVQKTAYQGGNNIVHQNFAITIYDDRYQVVTREVLEVKGNPTAVQTVRATTTPTADGWAYIAISATDNIGASVYPEDSVPAPSPYTLRIRHEGELAEGAITPLAVTESPPGTGFESACELTAPEAAAGDLKLGESAFFKTRVANGEVVDIAAAMQKPWYQATNYLVETRFTLTVYDDDQVEVAKKKLEVRKNPPDAHALLLTWTASLDGMAYFSLSSEHSEMSSIYPEGFDPTPGRIAVQVVKGGAAIDPKDDPFAATEEKSGK
jgi:hypothetical protein